jgi:hypothetical protein
MVCRARSPSSMPRRALGCDERAAPEDLQVISQDNDLSYALQQATDRLQRELGGRLPDATIAQCVSAAFEELSDARVKTYVPVLTYRLARERLTRLIDTRN